MARLRASTALNRHAAGEIQKRSSEELLTTCAEALLPAHELSQRPAETVTPAEVIAVLRALRLHRKSIEKLQLDLLGAAVLAGGTVDYIAASKSFSASTLTRRLPRTPARLLGREIVWDPAAEWGWRAI